MDYKQDVVYSPHLFKLIHRFLKRYDLCVVIEGLRASKLKNLKDYGLIEFHLKLEQAKMDRINSDKDETEITQEEAKTQDLRENEDKEFKTHKSKLDMLENL